MQSSKEVLLKKFEFERVINWDTREKKIILLGTIKEEDEKKKAMILLKKCEFDLEI